MKDRFGSPTIFLHWFMLALLAAVERRKTGCGGTLLVAPASVLPMTWPPRTPPPAITTLKARG